jgi:tetratricopeptide (TPR) repeat protein
MNYVLCLWPGAGGVFRQGRWPFLTIALLFGFVLCGTVTLNFYWTELLTGTLRWGMYVMLGFLWLTLSNQSSRMEKHSNFLRLPPPPDKDMLPDAQQHYLQGNWFEAECCLNILLQKNPWDIEAMLMLVTLYRHKERYDEAEHLVQELERLENADHWKFEIRMEKRKLIAATAKRSKNAKTKSTGNSSGRNEAVKRSA